MAATGLIETEENIAIVESRVTLALNTGAHFPLAIQRGSSFTAAGAFLGGGMFTNTGVKTI